MKAREFRVRGVVASAASAAEKAPASTSRSIAATRARRPLHAARELQHHGRAAASASIRIIAFAAASDA